MVSLTRPDLLRWLHLFVLSLGLNCGNFSIERILPALAPIPDHFSEIRYLCLPVLLLLTWLRKDFSLRHIAGMKEALFALGTLGVFLVYGVFRALGHDTFIGFYASLEPYLLVFIYGLMAAMALHDRKEAEDFLAATLVILLGVVSIYVGCELMTGPHYLATGYYYSREFYIGFTIALVMMFKGLDQKNRKTVVWMILFAVLFLFSGIATSMRAAIILYALSILALIPLMLALRNYGRLFIIMMIAVVAYSLGLTISGETLIIKQHAYSPFVTATNVPQPTAAEKAAIAREEADCARRIAAFVEETKEPVTKTEYSCKAIISVRDVDSRIRLLMSAVQNVASPLFGNGLGTYSFVDAARTSSPVTPYYYPHNIYIALYNETGLVGLALIGLSILFVLSVCVRVGMSENAPTIGLLCLLPLFFLLSGAIAGDFFDARYIWVAPFLLTAMLNTKPKE